MTRIRSTAATWIFAAFIVLLGFAMPIHAQTGTQPPAGGSPLGICQWNAETGQSEFVLVPSTITVTDTGLAGPGHDTLAKPDQTCVQADSTPVPTVLPTATVDVGGAKVTPTPTVLPDVGATPEPRVPEPTVPPGPLPDCSPDQPQGTPCGGK